MKLFRSILLVFSAFTLSHQAANGCSATVSPCNETCTISAPPDGSANCYTTDGVAYCIALDSDLEEVDRNTASCGSGNGAPGGENGEPDLNCQIYWWTCTQAY